MIQSNFEVVQDTYALDVQRMFEYFIMEFELSDQDPNIEFYEDPEGRSKKYYMNCIEKMKRDEKTTMFVDWEHVTQFSTERGNQDNDKQFCEDIMVNFYRFEPYLRKALLSCVLAVDPAFAKNKVFFVAFYNLPACNKLRNMKTNTIGQLTAIYGTVTRTTEVRPELLTGTFQCKDCNTIIRDIEQQFKYTLPQMCRNANCQNRDNFDLVVDQSEFTDWQKLRIQEDSGDIPAGSMPRSLDVIL